MTLLDALVVGCGRIGSGYDLERSPDPPLSHAGAYVTNVDVRLCAGSDPDPEACERFERRWAVRCYSDLAEALDAVRPAVVSVCTPPDGRVEVVEQVLAAGVQGIWIEKPLASTAHEGAAIVAHAERAGVALQVNFHRRFDPVHRAAAERVRADAGPVHSDFRFSGSLLNFGSHAFDLFRWFVGEPRRVRAIALPGRDPAAFVETEEGSTGNFQHIPTEATIVFEADFLTAHRRVTLAAAGEQYLEGRVAGSPLFRGVTRHEYDDGHRNGGIRGAMPGAVEGLVRSIRLREPPLCGGADGVAALRLYEAIREAAQSGATVEMDP
jgi:predicted dehydrogenase